MHVEKSLPGTERLIFRPISHAAAPELFGVWADPEVMEYLTLPPFGSLSEAKDMIDLLTGLSERGEAYRWTMIEKSTGSVLGTLGFHNVKAEHRRAEIGYEMGRRFWRSGYMSEALRALVSYCFREEEFNRLEAFVNAGNERSRRVLLRAGFTEEGVLREYEYACGAFVDQHVFSLLRRDWDAMEGRG